MKVHALCKRGSTETTQIELDQLNFRVVHGELTALILSAKFSCSFSLLFVQNKLGIQFNQAIVKRIQRIIGRIDCLIYSTFQLQAACISCSQVNLSLVGEKTYDIHATAYFIFVNFLP